MIFTIPPRTVNECGMSLMEVTLAVAIFSGVIAVSAQALSSFYAGVQLQKQRIESVNSCRAVMSLLSEKRRELAADFPESFLTYVNLREQDGWQEFLKPETGPIHLPGHAITVVCAALDGSAANQNTTPLQIHVISAWNGPRGHSLSTEVVSVLTDR